jgi:subtilase family serine protease
MTVESKQTIYETDIETYLPQVNMSRLYETLTPQNISLENVIQHRAELTELKSKIKQIDGNLENKEQMFFAQKQFVYPMATSGTTILIIIAIIIYIIRRNKREQIAIPPRRPPKPH